MAKVIAFPSPSPEKFGFKPVRRKKETNLEKHGQLNFFSGGKVVGLHQLSAFEEALLFDEQHDARAKDLYLKAIDQLDSAADAYCNLGILESEEKNYSKAIDYFTRSLKGEPRHYESHYNLANLYAEIGNLPLAKIHCQTSIEIEPDFPNSYFNLGLTLAATKEFEDAITMFKKNKSLASNESNKQVDELIENLESLGI